MDVVVTGSSGLIGTALVDALHAAGHHPIRLTRRDTSTARGRDDTLRWDPDAGTIDAAGFEGVDAVVHLAGESIASHRWTAEQKQRILESRVKGTTLIAETIAASRRPPRVLVSASAIGFYGDRGAAPLTETAPQADTFLAGVVGAWERAADPARTAGIRVAHPRTGIVLSRDSGALPKLLPLFRLGLGGRFGSGRQYWSWITLGDEVRALMWLLSHEVSGPVNLTSPNPVTNAEFTKALGHVLGRPALLPVPAFGPKVVVGTELATELLFTSANVLPAALLESGFEFEHPALEPALRSVLER
jgi:uncharacterized protein (TIGR01777 family)